MMLVVDDLGFSYASHAVLRDMSFKIEQHDLLAILGPNGVGKSTLLKCLNGILKPRHGSIMIENKETRTLGRTQKARLMGYVPQKAESSRITVYDLILLGRKPHIQWTLTEEDHKIVADVIDAIGLEHLVLTYADEISGGEFQMVQLARALAQQPRVILLDEPTSNLDIANQLHIMSILSRIVQSHPMVAVMAIHDINLALRYSNKFLLLRDGAIYAAGGREIITAENISKVYDVDVTIQEVNGIPFMVPVTSLHSRTALTELEQLINL
jgi:iron complex transport system ATP-binding protein